MNLFAESNSKKSKICCILILIVLTSIVYFNSLQGAFQFDDRNLLNKEWLADLDSFNKNVSLISIENRPILLWSFALNNDLNKKNTFGFHLLNLIIHTLVTLLIFVILIRIKNITFKGYACDEGKSQKLIDHQIPDGLLFPFATTLIFALHPINTDSVSYISSRSSLLATFFYLLTIYFFIETLVPFRKLKHQITLGLLIFLGMYLAIASKLIAITLPVVIIFLLVLFYAPRYFSNYGKYFTTSKIICFFGFGGIVLILLVYLFKIQYLPKDQGFELYGSIPYLLVQSKVIIFYYLTKFIFPINLNVDSAFPFTEFLVDWKIFFSIILIISIIWVVLKWGNIWLKLGCAWFFLLISPTSSIVPLNDLAVEHRMYLPMSLGLCFISGWLISCAKQNRRIYIFIFIVLIFSVLVSDRNQSWTSEIALWSDSAKKNPNSSRVQNNLGKAYYEAGKLKLARSHLEKSVLNISKYTKTKFNIKDPKKFIERKNIVDKTFQDRKILRNKNILIHADLAQPHYNLASVYLDLGQLEGAKIQYQSALKINPNYYSAELGMGSLKNMTGEYEAAIDHFIKSISLMKKATGQPDYALARLNLGEIYAKTQRYNKAIIELNRALKINPSMLLAHYNLGTAYMLTGEFSKAELSLKAALKIKPNHEPAIFNLARVYQNKKQWINSNEVFNKFIKIKGPDPYVYSEIAGNNLMSGNLEQASALYEKVLNYKPNHKVALINLAKINYNLGKFKIAQVYIERVLKLDLTKPQSDDLNKLLKAIKSLNS